MTRRLITGNEALAWGALRAGVKVATGYPGTPSTGALASLLDRQLARDPACEGRYFEWSVNEKVALEVATGAAWAGHRALCTMKMSGLNVAYDSLCSVAYSGTVGGLVIYVADDPGASAGMVEQDTRGFAQMSDLPMLEPATPAEAYRAVQTAFELSERTGAPVFVRLVTSTALSYGLVEVEDPLPPPDRAPVLQRDINKYTKAGAAIVMAQHRDALARLARAGALIREWGLNDLRLSARAGGLGIIAAGVVASYLPEAHEVLAQAATGFDPGSISVLKIGATNPLPDEEIRALLAHCRSILVLEELEPYIERGVYVEAQRLGYDGPIIGKLDGTLSRVGEYGVAAVLRGLTKALGLPYPADLLEGAASAEALAAPRPITVCAGCPHRGTFMAINRALRKLRLKPDQVMVTGDIGCTILGMNPPFSTVWNEISMGASIGLAQGFALSGLETPVIATIGDSTFFHAGLPALVNVVQHDIPITVIILDNGWTAMTGMQVNPGTPVECLQGQQAGRRVDIAEIIPALGVQQFFVVDPFDLDGTTETIWHALTLPGVKVVLARQECAIQAQRRGEKAGQPVTIDEEKCNLCKLCIQVTGCAALSLAGNSIAVDPTLCYGCNLCASVCNRDAILTHEAPVEAGAA